MAKRHPFKKVGPGKPIPVTARQLESFMLEHKGKYRVVADITERIT